MPLKGLKEATASLRLVDTHAVFEQGRKAYMLGTDYRDRDSSQRGVSYEIQNPFKAERERRIWQQGFDEARRKFELNSRTRREYANN